MPRSTRRLVLPLAATTAALALGAVAVSLFVTQNQRDTTFAGTYTSDTDLRVTNLRIPGGHLSVGYSVDVLYLPEGPGPSAGRATGIRCGLVDTSGRLDLFEPSRTTAQPGAWATLSFDANYILPRLTLGLRCSPNADGAATVVFRDAELHAVPID
jgi:hypothetical protein